MQRIVVPGEKIHNQPLRVENTISDNNGTYSCVLGSFDEETKTMVPLEGLWQPKSGDTIVGLVEEDRGTTFTVNLNAPYKGLIISCILPLTLHYEVRYEFPGYCSYLHQNHFLYLSAICSYGALSASHCSFEIVSPALTTIAMPLRMSSFVRFPSI